VNIFRMSYQRTAASHMAGQDWPSNDVVHHSAVLPRDRSRVMGVCWVLYGVFRLAAALLLFIYSGTGTVMFGALFNRAPNPFALMCIFHFLYAAIIIWSVACGVLGILAGLALLSARGRALAIIAAFLSLADLPFGVTLGVYTLIKLLLAVPVKAD
jgi:hypothetical protein